MHYLGKKTGFSIAVASAVLLAGALAGCNKTESAASLVAEAKQFEAKGDTKSAIIQLKNAVVKNPDDGQARLMLGTLYSRTGDAPSAEKELRKALALGVSADAVMPALALALLGERRYQNVIDETAALAAKKDMRVMTARGDAYLALGKPVQAAEAYDSALAAQPDHLGALIGKARVALTQGDVAAATAIADGAVAKSPKQAEAWLFKGDLLRAANQREAALAAYDKVLALEPAHRSAHVEKASIEIATNKFDAAQADLDAARKLAPNSPMVNYTQALLDFTQQKYPAARESQQKVLRLAPDHMPTVLMAGATELALGAYAQAEQYLKKYLESAPDNLYARKLMATTLLKLGRAADASAALAPALRGVGAKDPQILALAGEISLQEHDFAKATGYLQQAEAITPDKAGLHTALAQSRLGQGDSERAVAELETATKLDATAVKPGMLLVLTELRLNHTDKALAAASRLEAQQPNDPSVKNLKGGVYLSKGDKAAARASFEQALKLQPGFFPAVSNLAQMELQDGHPELAKKRLSAFVDTQPQHAEALNALAALAAGQGQPAEATSWLERGLADSPDAIAPTVVLVGHYLRTGERQKALTLVRKAQVAHPESTELLDLLGQAHMANGDAAAALDSFSKLAGMQPKSALAHMRLAGTHMQMNNPAAAADDLKKALALQPDYLDAQVAQIQLAARAGRLDAALAIAQDIVKQRPKQAVGYVAQGDILMLQKKPAPAAQAFETAFGISKAAPELLKLHFALKQAGRAKEGDARLAQFEHDHPNDIAIALYVADGSINAKQYDVAAKQLGEIVKRAPRNALAMNNLAWVYAQQNDAHALPTAEQALKLAPDSPAIMDTLGTILVGQGDTARGLPYLQKAVAAVPANPEFRFHLASGLVKAGDKAGARKELEKLIASNSDFVQIADVRALLRQL